MRRPKPSSSPTKPSGRGRRPHRYPNRIHELTRQRRVTYAQLGDQVGAHETTIARLASGDQRLTHDWMKRLGDALSVRPEELISGAGGRPLRTVRVKGDFKAGVWALSHEWPEDEQFDVMIPDDADMRGLQLYAGRIAGEATNLRFPSGSVVVLSRVGQRPGEIAIGKRYHVRTTRADGLIEETIKLLVADDHGQYWLRPESSHPEFQQWLPLDGNEEVKVDLIGRVRFVVHRED